MCLLNGELGGQLFASVDFGKEEIRTKIVQPVKIEGTGSSDTLTTGTYYIKLDKNDLYILDENDSNYEELQNSKMSIIDQNNELYEFIESSTGYYYKFENTYKIISTEFDDNISWNGKRFDIYKKVNGPRDMFKQVTFGDEEGQEKTYEENKYYYQTISNDNDSGYFLLNTTGLPKENGNNWKAVQLYRLDYEYHIEKAPLEKIIRESVHAYAQEPYHNIIINDLDEYGLEQTTYIGDKTLYALRNYKTGHFDNLTYKENLNAYMQNIINQGGTFRYDSLSSGLTDEIGTIFWFVKQVKSITSYVQYENVCYSYTDNPTEYIVNKHNPLQVGDRVESKLYTIAEITYGTDLGYRLTDLTYTGDLISSIGESLTSILDKIKQMLGDFEYFYDIDGKFIFQKKKNYVNSSWSHIVDNKDETYVEYSNNSSKFSFNFEGNRLITTIANTPVLTNLKNDYSVWGKRKTLSGTEVPIHARYAIDRKPKLYRAFNGVVYYTEDYENQNELTLTQLWQNEYNKIINKTVWTQNLNLIPDFLKQNDESDWYEFNNWLDSFKTKPIDFIQSYSPGQGNGFSGNITIGDNMYTLNDQFILILHKQDDQYKLIQTYYNLYTNTHTEINATTYHTTGNNCYYQDIINELNQNPELNLCAFIYSPQIGEQENQESASEVSVESLKVDWRELIYRMAIDYFAGQGCSSKEPIYDKYGNFVLDDPDHFLYKVGEYNPEFYPTGYTGYEQYYTDMQGFWRQLYNPDYIPKLIFEKGKYTIKTQRYNNSSYFITTKEWQEGWADNIEIDYYIKKDSDIYISIKNEFLSEGEDNSDGQLSYNTKADNETVRALLDKYSVQSDNDKLYWNINVFENPEVLNFWIEFLDNGETLGAYQIRQIGSRQMVVNDDQVKAIYYKEIPDIILYSAYADDNVTPLLTKKGLRQSIQSESGYTFVYIPKGFSQYLQISYRSKSAKDKIDELLYQHSYCIENITITALPIYHLQPNTRIFVSDKKTGINGEYIVSKISLPLNYNGTMSITATKAPERIL